MNILVLAGGLSPERNVSLTSGRLITEALRRRGHKVRMRDVYMDVDNKEDGEWDDGAVIWADPATPPDLEQLKKEAGKGESLIGEGILELCKAADVVFLALHGAMGENGQLQATLDVHGVKYTGSGYAGSLLAMDKDISKKLLRSADIPTPDWLRVDTHVELDMKKIISTVGLPAVVKPCSCGSSVGVSIVDAEEELERAIKEAAVFERYILVERKISGREFTCGFVDGRALPPVEIIPKKGFYDYKNKYVAGATEEICPPILSEEEETDIYSLTERGFETLMLRGYARFDYILDSDGMFWCLEANTLPGMTPTSLLPMEAEAVGISYDELCEKLALLALKK
ncbi:MAG: D-alanine--D-alanine ligase [Clostridia bacterium]|nr:D-alanine--D-alanine ligase [Clostridia bacterium]